MWADSLLAAEGAHLLRVLLWGAASLLVGSALQALLQVGSRRSALLEQFAIQTAAWGAAEVTLAAIARTSLGLRDLAGATRLDLTVGGYPHLDIAYRSADSPDLIHARSIGREHR